VKEGETTNDLFAFLTTDANKVVGAIHPKAMPVMLTKPEELPICEHLVHSNLMPAALIIGHHFSISAF
jgi:hypothetical protein